jgi:excisionase family DNA binding protein
MKKRAMERPLLITVKETAKLLSIGTTKVWQLIRLNELDSIKIGTCRRVRTESVIRFVERSQQQRLSQISEGRL